MSRNETDLEERIRFQLHASGGKEANEAESGQS